VHIVERIIGIVLIVAAIQDVFHTLFHPAKQGNISDRIARSIWRIIRKGIPRSLELAGPLAFTGTVLFWVISIIIGFALLYAPVLPQQFVYASGLNRFAYGSFLGALDLSIGSLITLSTGMYSNNPGIGLIMGLESIVGFGLLTASVSWILSIYPVLEHRKSLAREATLLHFSEYQSIRRLDEISDTDVQQILLGLASQLSTSRNELIQFPITYYFHEDEKETSLAGILPYLADIAEINAKRSGAAALAAVALGGAVDDYLRVVASLSLRRKFTNRDEILRALAEDHMREIARSPSIPEQSSLRRAS
jgi:hypothetical protein